MKHRHLAPVLDYGIPDLICTSYNRLNRTYGGEHNFGINNAIKTAWKTTGTNRKKTGSSVGDVKVR
jgi:hypothetical protein